MRKAKRRKDVCVVNIRPTFCGGSVAEMPSSLTLVQRAIVLRTDWRLIQGGPTLFSVTKKLHDALQRGEINLSDRSETLSPTIPRVRTCSSHGSCRSVSGARASPGDSRHGAPKARRARADGRAV